MANYSVYVRNYHWTHQDTLVQSPVLDLNAPPSTLVIRPLEGANKDEPRVISNVTDLKDDIQEDGYQTEAHGVVISTNPQEAKHFPVWVPIHNYRCGEGEVHVVNLATSEGCQASIANTCWVPGFEAPDGSLYTVVGIPRTTNRVSRVMVLVQQLGEPRKAKLTLLDPLLLAGYEEINSGRKKRLFAIQFRAIQTKSASFSTITQNAYRIYLSPYRHEYGRLTLDEVLSEDLEVLRYSYSENSSHGSFSSSGDDDSVYTRPTYASLVKVPNRPYNCDCRYAVLLPTYTNPRPSHRHGTDEECTLGSAHKHCVFVDHILGCIIPMPMESHKHCVHPLVDMQFDFEQSFGPSATAEADELYEQARRDHSDLGPTDSELALDNSHLPSPPSSPSSLFSPSWPLAMDE